MVLIRQVTGTAESRLVVIRHTSARRRAVGRSVRALVHQTHRLSDQSSARRTVRPAVRPSDRQFALEPLECSDDQLFTYFGAVRLPDPVSAQPSVCPSASWPSVRQSLANPNSPEPVSPSFRPSDPSPTGPVVRPSDRPTVRPAVRRFFCCLR